MSSILAAITLPRAKELWSHRAGSVAMHDPAATAKTQSERDGWRIRLTSRTSRPEEADQSRVIDAVDPRGNQPPTSLAGGLTLCLLALLKIDWRFPRQAGKLFARGTTLRLPGESVIEQVHWVADGDGPAPRVFPAYASGDRRAGSMRSMRHARSDGRRRCREQRLYRDHLPFPPKRRTPRVSPVQINNRGWLSPDR